MLMIVLELVSCTLESVFSILVERRDVLFFLGGLTSIERMAWVAKVEGDVLAVGCREW